MLQRVLRSGALPWGIPAVAVFGSYLWLAWDHGDVWLWNVTVHESGAYTFGETILYFRHFLRELPVDIAYALFLVAAAIPAAPRGDGHEDPDRAARSLWPTTLLAAGLVVVAATAAVREAGLASALLDLGQFRTRDDLVAYGSHWRFHWLSTIWFGCAVAVLAGPVLGATRHSRGRAAWRVAWATVIGATVAFGVSPEIFTDVRYVGHQAREIATHGAVTLWVGFAILRAQSGSPGGARSRATDCGEGDETGWRHLGAATLVVAIPAYLAVSMLRGDVMAVAQSDRGLAAMVAGHLFEHTLDFVLVGLLTAVGYGWFSRTARR
jgi:hypothetical protein